MAWGMRASAWGSACVLAPSAPRERSASSRRNRGQQGRDQDLADVIRQGSPTLKKPIQNNYGQVARKDNGGAPEPGEGTTGAEPVAHGPSGLQTAGRRIEAVRASLIAAADMSGHKGPCPDTLISAQPTAVFHEPQVGAIFASDGTTLTRS
jgi:hypothetical protein